MPPRMNREQRALVRLLQLSVWVQQRGADGFTFADVKEQFPDAYRGTAQADKQWTRDKTQLRRMGLRMRKTARGVYVVDSSASRARALRLTPAEVAVLDDVAAFIPSVPFPDAAHHLDRGLRKLALSGVPLRSGSEGRAAATRAAWDEANARLPDLRGHPWAPARGGHRLSGPGNGVRREAQGRTHEGLPAEQGHRRHQRSHRQHRGIPWRAREVAPARPGGGAAAARTESGLRMSGYFSLVDGLADEVSRKWNARSGAAPRPNVTSMQRRSGSGYLLLNAMIEA